ncbi:TPA: hypothetical protein DCW54_03520 [Candidatus Dependentiae bacterium]|nr:hypothetical protein [Candidatus Dependentiae bacterium]
MIQFSFVNAVVVAIGGGVGTLLRYLALCFFEELHCQQPLALLIINTVGCCAMGYLVGLMCPVTRWIQFISIGVLGGFTTFSSYAGATHELYYMNANMWAISYALLSPAVGLLGFILGRGLA